MGIKLIEYGSNTLGFTCPGCGYDHSVTVKGKKNESGASWGWNESMERPTFTPSIGVFMSVPKMRCHSFVKDGQIQFLNDSFHKLAGKTVEIPDME